MKNLILLLTNLLTLITLINLSAQAVVEPDYIIIGRDALPPATPISDTLFFFDQSKGAFRGGLLENSDAWAPDSLGTYSFAHGYNTKASGGNGATALGHFTTASGDRGATALGYFTTASGDNGATSIGFLTEATGGAGATALGSNTTASGGNGATALGSNTTASGDIGATALGYFTTASGDNGATSIGFLTEATGDNCTVVGRYNDTIVTAGQDVIPTSPLFIVGNGDYGVGMQSNALVVRKDGKVGIGTSSPNGLLHIEHNSTGPIPQLQLSQNNNDGARINFDNDQTTDYWTLFGRPRNSGNSDFNIFYQSEEAGGGTTGNKLRIFGNGNATLEGILTQNSDRRLKKDIVPIANALDKILAIHGYSYHWKTDQDGVDKKIGVIAQEVHAVLPDLVLEDEDGMLSVSYTSLVPVLIEGMKEQQEEIDKTKEVVLQLQKQIDELKNLITNESK